MGTGEYVRAVTVWPEAPGAVVVPERAVQDEQVGSYVLVVAADDRVERRPVTLGGSHEGMVHIAEGLAAGERVVVEGIQKARPGSRVRPREGPTAGRALAQALARPRQRQRREVPAGERGREDPDDEQWEEHQAQPADACEVGDKHRHRQRNPDGQGLMPSYAGQHLVSTLLTRYTDLASLGPHRPSHSRRRGSKPNVFFAFWFEAPRSFVP